MAVLENDWHYYYLFIFPWISVPVPEWQLLSEPRMRRQWHRMRALGQTFGHHVNYMH